MKYWLTILTSALLISNTTADGLIGGVQFGDSESTVIDKLKQSPLVKTELDKSLFGRVGLNGSFETANTLRGMKFKLFFDWNYTANDKKLTQITYRSVSLPLSSYNSRLKEAWTHAQNLLTTMYGKPSNAGEYPSLGKLPDGGIMYSHAWKTNDGYVYLGIGKQNAKLNLSIGFHKNSLK